MSKTLESAYFHNLGLTLEVTEVVEDNTPEWTFHVRFQAFGSRTNLAFPLHPSIIDWAQGALDRTNRRMSRYPKKGPHGRIVTVQDGEDVPVGG